MDKNSWEYRRNQQQIDDALKSHSDEGGPRHDDSSELLAAMRQGVPDHWAWRSPVATKRIADAIRMAVSAQDTSPRENARLEQSNADPRINPSQDPKLSDIFGGEVLSDARGVARVRRERPL